MAEGRRGRDRQVDRRQEGLRGRRDDRRAGRGAGRAASASPGIVQFGSARRASAARRSPASTSRPRRRCSTSGASSTRSRSPRSPASRPGSSLKRSSRSCRRAPRCGPARQQAAEDAQDTTQLHLVPARLPARVRRDRALRRQLRDRELALDHDRAADARVRDAADARRVAAAGARLDRDRGARRSATLASIAGLVLGLRAREGPLQAVRRRRVHAAEQRPHRSRRGRSSWRCSSGIVVTLLASLRPAFRATRVPPIAAVREGATLPESRFARFRTRRLDVLAARSGLPRSLFGLFGAGPRHDADAALDRASARCSSSSASRCSRPGSSARSRTVLGWPAARIGGAAGALARDNAQRNPQRTASTAAALMIGLALVTLVAVLAAGITSTFRGAVNEIWGGADYAITAQNNFSPIPTRPPTRPRRRRASRRSRNVRTGDGAGVRQDDLRDGRRTRDAARSSTLDWVEGSQAMLATLGATARSSTRATRRAPPRASARRSTLTFANGDDKHLVVKGIFDPPAGGSPFGPVTISRRDVGRDQREPAEPLLVRADARRRDRRERAALEQRARGRSRTRRRRRGRSSSTTRSRA